jgi:polyhydroxybutyrate depolymerase
MLTIFPLLQKFLGSRKSLAALTLVTLAATAAAPNTALAWTRLYDPGTGLRSTPGTVSWIENYTWDGIARSAIFIRPDPMPTTSAPAIVLLHYLGGTSKQMGNLTHAGTLAATKGAWVILPQGINYTWNSNPSDLTNTVDDVGFLANVIQTATAKYPIDPTRVSMAGFSEGGFMSTFFACQRADLLASILSDAATVRTSVTTMCAPSHPVPAVFVLGTADPIVSYAKNNWGQSAQNSYSYWSAINGCDTKQSLTTNLPVIVNDGTSVTLQHNAACNSGGEVDLYTVNGGGHAWPGGLPVSWGLGTTSQNLDTTALLGKFASMWSASSTH